MTAADDITQLSYEKALGELDGIIERLERGAVALDEAIAAYERGAALAQRCAELLDRTEQKVSQLVIGSGGGVTEKPLVTADAVPARRASPVDPDEIPF
jgi:exodeoxyribonuclease VII small subunit